MIHEVFIHDKLSDRMSYPAVNESYLFYQGYLIYMLSFSSYSAIRSM